MAAQVITRSEAGAEGVFQRFLTEKEVGLILGVNIKSLQKWRMQGRGPSWKKFLSKVRYDAEALNKWIADQPGGGS